MKRTDEQTRFFVCVCSYCTVPVKKNKNGGQNAKSAVRCARGRRWTLGPACLGRSRRAQPEGVEREAQARARAAAAPRGFAECGPDGHKQAVRVTAVASTRSLSRLQLVMATDGEVRRLDATYSDWADEEDQEEGCRPRCGGCKRHHQQCLVVNSDEQLPYLG